ncbi:FAD/NAD(P)-binding oxidoreductase [Pseudomonas sp. NFR16]|uniref:NAD(P)/FAD-dependent oxidoreductase n=1 Tax=Pseudomonas sp. NFR16 TaxID=1566248 RepID=UPI0008B633EB|nr:FAD/NAD(P)-binding oxidoreductase [Pseudomonas sp. NFR16]SEJ05222.1 NADPH-dependent 2,4-dienoyl-CoA reductase, sulfur reductase [Pseudomonas sp. NFR16]
MSRPVDLLIIGAGPAGMAAALAAAPSGINIALLDDNPVPGGQIWRDGPQAQLPGLASDMRAQLARHPNIHLHSACKVVALAGHKRLLLEDPERGWLLSYHKLILCTGARERLLPFPGWTLPGVTGAGGLQALIKGGLSVDGERVVVAGTGPLLLASAATARKNGARIVRVAEQAGPGAVGRFAMGLWQWPNKAIQALTLFSGAYRTAAHVVEALGSDRLEAVRIQMGGRVEEVACERLACGFSLVPNVEVAKALGCEVRDQAIVVDDWQASTLTDHYAAGECTGFGGSELALVEGRIAGLVAIDRQDQARALWPQRQRWQRFADRLNRAFALDPALKRLAAPDTLVCRCEDVAYASLVEHGTWSAAKLNTRCGMGACQGRICSTAAQTLFGWEPPVLRPPFSPARIATLACLDEAEPAA